MNKTIISTQQRQTVQTSRRDVKIATLRGKEAREIWKALGKDGLVYNAKESSEGGKSV